MMPATSATKPAMDQTMTQILRRRYPDGQRRLVIVRHRPQRAPGLGVLGLNRVSTATSRMAMTAAQTSRTSIYMP